jgi:hypothetical protein
MSKDKYWESSYTTPPRFVQYSSSGSPTVVYVSPKKLKIRIKSAKKNTSNK